METSEPIMDGCGAGRNNAEAGAPEVDLSSIETPAARLYDLRSYLEQGARRLIRETLAYQRELHKAIADCHDYEYSKEYSNWDTSGDAERLALFERARAIKTELYYLNSLMATKGRPSEIGDILYELIAEPSEDAIDEILECSVACALHFRDVDRAEPDTEHEGQRRLLNYRQIGAAQIPSRVWIDNAILHVVKLATLLHGLDREQDRADRA